MSAPPTATPPGAAGVPCVPRPCLLAVRQREGRVALGSLDVALGLGLGRDLGGVCDQPYLAHPERLRRS